MKYRVAIDGRTREIDVQVTPDGRATVILDGKPVEAEVVPVPGGVHLRMAGRVYDVIVGGTAGETHVAIGGERAIAQVESERARAQGARRKAAGSGPAAKELRAPMPGRIVKVLVKAGDAVEANTPLVIIEAMKMENELRATIAQTIASVEVREGQSVEANAVLVRFA